MTVAIVLVLLVVGSVLFHVLSPWYFTPIASNWGTIDDTVSITFWVTGVVFVAVNLFVAYAVLRFRHRKGVRAAYEPENKKLEGWLVGLTTLGVAAMLAPGLFVWAKIVDVPQDAAAFEALGSQWRWAYRFPGVDGVMGTVDARHVSERNPFGMNPDDPNGRDDVLVSSPEVHLPLGKPLKAHLRSIDVLHNFAVPQFRVKMDLVPGMVTYIWFTPTRSGRFDLLCEELCGMAHFTMRGRVVVEPESEFRAWLARQPTFAQTQAKAPADATAGQAAYAVCAACHGAQGEGNPALHAPKLSGQPGWYLERQLRNFKGGARGVHENDVFGKQMAPMAAVLADDTAVANVVAHIASLPDQAAAPTVTGDAGAGRQLYATSCAACHGADARGRPAMNAPRLAGMSDWYLATQLRNFKQGIRGGHADDPYGAQMASMAASLAGDREIGALVAHINTLK
jgi:cytochrome c oxidase subunit 2